MPWSEDLINLPISVSEFSKPVSPENDSFLRGELLKINNEINTINWNDNQKKPFVYFAIGTANESINGTNPSIGGYVSDENVQRQQYPEEFIANMISRGYYCFVINIDSFVQKQIITEECLKRQFINAAFPLAGTVLNSAGEASSIRETINLFKTAIEKGGKVLFLNCVEETDNFSIFTGIKYVLQEYVKTSDIIYASSYLQLRNTYNLFKLVYPSRNLYLSNEEVSNLTYEEVWV